MFSEIGRTMRPGMAPLPSFCIVVRPFPYFSFMLHASKSGMHWLYETIRHVLSSWGYWALLLGLFAESLGLPLPGETMLMFASFLTHKNSGLRIQWVIPIAVAAAVMGDNAGYWLGRHFGRTFIRWAKRLLRMDDTDIQTAKRLIRTHGGRTIFSSRFIFGLRTIAGPMAGSLGMEWRRFFKFNLLGAATWVVAVAFTGYAFANEFDTLLGYIEKASWAIAGGLLLAGYLIWKRQKHRYQEQRRAA
jgi:membrane protein DedA with SNARE-associated domain